MRRRLAEEDVEPRLGALEGAKVAAVLIHGIFHSCPGGEMVGHTDLFYRGQVDNPEFEIPRAQRSGFNVVLDAFGKPREKKLKARSPAGCRCIVTCSHFEALW